MTTKLDKHISNQAKAKQRLADIESYVRIQERTYRDSCPRSIDKIQLYLAGATNLEYALERTSKLEKTKASQAKAIQRLADIDLYVRIKERMYREGCPRSIDKIQLYLAGAPI